MTLDLETLKDAVRFSVIKCHRVFVAESSRVE